VGEHATRLMKLVCKTEKYSAEDLQVLRETLVAMGGMSQPQTPDYLKVRTTIELMDDVRLLDASIWKFDQSSTELAKRILWLTWVYTVVAVLGLGVGVLALLR